jgi:hypothetical protein
MTVTLTVDATWRLSRVEFNTPYNSSGLVQGFSEVLLQEPETPSPGAEMLRTTTPLGETEPVKTYGTMPGKLVRRDIEAIKDEEVEVGGDVITFESLMYALSLFFERWRVEDAEKPETPASMRVQGVPLTPVGTVHPPPEQQPGD